MNRNIEIMAAIIAAGVVVDKTEPNPANPGEGWRTEVLLQEAYAYIVGQLNDPGTYVEMCRKALVRVQNRPEIAALLQVAIFWGERLLPMDAEREQLLARMKVDLRTAISALPNGPRKARCTALLDYHKGAFP